MEAFSTSFDKQIRTIVKILSHFDRLDFAKTWVCGAVIC
jgi:hypothetical protein